MKKCSQSSDDGNEEWTRKRKEHALLLERSFSKNLDEAIKFYRDLLKAVRIATFLEASLEFNRFISDVDFRLN